MQPELDATVVDDLDEHGSTGEQSIESNVLRRLLKDGAPFAGDSQYGLQPDASTSSPSGTRHVEPNLKHAETFRAMNQTLQASAPKFMWESNNFLNAIFNPGVSVVD